MGRHRHRHRHRHSHVPSKKEAKFSTAVIVGLAGGCCLFICGLIAAGMFGAGMSLPLEKALRQDAIKEHNTGVLEWESGGYSSMVDLSVTGLTMTLSGEEIDAAGLVSFISEETEVADADPKDDPMPLPFTSAFYETSSPVEFDSLNGTAYSWSDSLSVELKYTVSGGPEQTITVSTRPYVEDYVRICGSDRRRRRRRTIKTENEAFRRGWMDDIVGDIVDGFIPEPSSPECREWIGSVCQLWDDLKDVDWNSGGGGYYDCYDAPTFLHLGDCSVMIDFNSGQNELWCGGFQDGNDVFYADADPTPGAEARQFLLEIRAIDDPLYQYIVDPWKTFGLTVDEINASAAVMWVMFAIVAIVWIVIFVLVVLVCICLCCRKQSVALVQEMSHASTTSAKKEMKEGMKRPAIDPSVGSTPGQIAVQRPMSAKFPQPIGPPIVQPQVLAGTPERHSFVLPGNANFIMVQGPQGQQFLVPAGSVVPGQMQMAPVVPGQMQMAPVGAATFGAQASQVPGFVGSKNLY